MQSKGRKLYHSSTKRLGQKGYPGYALAKLHHTKKKHDPRIKLGKLGKPKGGQSLCFVPLICNAEIDSVMGTRNEEANNTTPSKGSNQHRCSVLRCVVHVNVIICYNIK